MLKNRLHPYEAGWLTLLVKMRVATEAEARAAMQRVANEAIEELEARRAAKRELRRKKRRENGDG